MNLTRLILIEVRENQYITLSEVREMGQSLSKGKHFTSSWLREEKAVGVTVPFHPTAII